MFTNKSKSWVLVAVVVMLSMLLAQCAPAATEAPAAPADTAAPAAPAAEEKATEAPAAAPAEEEPFKVGLISPGPVNDQGWNQLAYDSLLNIEKEMGAEISYVEVAESPAEFEKALTDYASQGYQFVIAHGYQFQDAVEKVAPNFPDTVFVTSGGEKFGPNYGPVVMALWEPLYLVGVIAGNLTKTGKGAYIGGMEIPAISGPYEGLKQGFETVEGNTLSITYINSWEDVGAAKEAALAAVAEGADFIVANANIAGTGVFQVANENKIWTAGLNADQTSEAPDYILANGVIDYPASFLTIAKAVKDGTFVGNQPIVLTLKNEDAVYLSYNPKTQNLITPEIQALVDEAAAKIKSGEILVDGDYTRK